MDDSQFLQITCHRGAAGAPIAILRGSGIRVGTLWATSTAWSWSPEDIAREYGLTLDQVEEALSFGAAHQAEIEADMVLEEELERTIA